VAVTLVNGGAASGASSSSNVATYTGGTASTLPAVGDVILVAVVSTGQTATDWTFTDDKGGTYTRLVRQLWQTSTCLVEIYARNQLVTTAAAHIITYAHASGNASGATFQQYYVHGSAGEVFRVGAAIAKQTAAGGGAAASVPTNTFAAAMTSKPLLALVGNISNPDAVTQPAATGWVAGASRAYNTPTTGFHSDNNDTGETDSVITWGSTSATEWAAVAVEIETAPPSINTNLVVQDAAHAHVSDAPGTMTGGSTLVVQDSVLGQGSTGPGAELLNAVEQAHEPNAASGGVWVPNEAGTGSGVTVADDTTEKHAGTASVRVNVPNAGYGAAYVARQIPAGPLMDFDFAVWVKLNTGSGPLTLALYCYNAASGFAGTLNFAPDITPSGVWTRYTVRGTTFVDTAYVRPAVQNSGVQSWWQDDASLIAALGLVQQQNLIVANGAHAHIADAPGTMAQQSTLIVQDATSAHVSDVPTLVQTAPPTNLAVQDGAHAHTSDVPTLVQQHVLVIAAATHAATSDVPTLIQQHVIAPAAGQHALTSDAPGTMVQNTVLVVADAAHGHIADGPGLVQNSSLIVTPATHLHAADNVPLSSGGALGVADALHAHVAGSPTLIQQHVLAVDPAQHAHTSPGVVLGLPIPLVVADGMHAHSSGQPALAQTYVLVIQPGVHAVSSDQVAVIGPAILVVASAIHDHAASIIVLTSGLPWQVKYDRIRPGVVDVSPSGSEQVARRGVMVASSPSSDDGIRSTTPTTMQR
jgi:hypothetical protein